MCKIIPLEMRNFKQHIDNEKKIKTIIIDCYHDECKPCKQIQPMVDKLADEVEGKVKVLSLNTKEQPGLANSLFVRGVPTFIKLEWGYEVDRIVGTVGEAKMQKFFIG